MHVNRRFAACFAFVMAPLSGFAQMAPTDVDLKSAYCLRTLKLQVGILRDTAAGVENVDVKANINNFADGVQNDINRIASYLVPKSYLDPSGLLTASARADVDLVAARNQNAVCSQRCGTADASPKWLACARSCSEEQPALARINACYTVNWLPF